MEIVEKRIFFYLISQRIQDGFFFFWILEFLTKLGIILKISESVAYTLHGVSLVDRSTRIPFKESIPQTLKENSHRILFFTSDSLDGEKPINYQFAHIIQESFRSLWSPIFTMPVLYIAVIIRLKGILFVQKKIGSYRLFYFQCFRHIL